MTLLWERWNKHLLTTGKEVIKCKRNNAIQFQLGKTVSVLRWSPPQSVWVKVAERAWLKVTCVTKSPLQHWSWSSESFCKKYRHLNRSDSLPRSLADDNLFPITLHYSYNLGWGRLMNILSFSIARHMKFLAPLIFSPHSHRECFNSKEISTQQLPIGYDIESMLLFKYEERENKQGRISLKQY